MPRKSCEPTATPIDIAEQDDAAGEEVCPKCSVAMEPIEIGVEGLPLQRLQLCPRCYLVTWSDQYGLHARQGVPMKKGFTPEGGSMRLIDPTEEC
jgi:hypothetical protein